MKNNEKQQAVRLRCEEKLSLREIQKFVPVSKSTLSLWLRNYPLDDDIKKNKQKAGLIIKQNNMHKIESIGAVVFDNLTSSEKGQLAVLQVELRSVAKRAIFSKPNIESCRYDCIIDENDVLYRVQIKLANGISKKSSNVVTVGLQQVSRSGKVISGYSNKEIDAIVVYIPAINQICWFPPEIWLNKSMLQIRLGATKNGQKKGCLFAEDFIW